MLDDPQKVFDRYCKNVQNGWEHDTPPVRLSLLGFEADGSPAKTVLEQAELQCPLAREDPHHVFLDAMNMTMGLSAPSKDASTSYSGHDLESEVGFRLVFDEYTEIAGYSKLKLSVSCTEKDEMDIVCQIRKIDATGRPLVHLNFPCPFPMQDVPNVNTAKTLGPQGFLRASHAMSLEERSSVGNELFYIHRVRVPIPPDDIVAPEIPIWPMGMVFAPGAGILLMISAHNMCFPEIPEMKATEAYDANVGNHALYTGPSHLSYLSFPAIPGKIRA